MFSRTFKKVHFLLCPLIITALNATSVSAQTTPKFKVTTAIPADITTPDEVESRLEKLKFFDGFPDDETVQKVYDNLDFINGVNAFPNISGNRRNFQD